MFEIRDGKVFLSADIAKDIEWVNRARNRGGGAGPPYVHVTHNSLEADDGFRVHKVRRNTGLNSEAFLDVRDLDICDVRSLPWTSVIGLPAVQQEGVKDRNPEEEVLDRIDGIEIMFNKRMLLEALDMPSDSEVLIKVTVSGPRDPIKVEDWNAQEDKPGMYAAAIMPLWLDGREEDEDEG
jgi:hypothetical protein